QVAKHGQAPPAEEDGSIPAAAVAPEGGEPAETAAVRVWLLPGKGLAPPDRPAVAGSGRGGRTLRGRRGQLRFAARGPGSRAGFDPAWRTAAAVALARSLYEDRRFGDMPLLADALEEAGCADEATLSHCRGPGPHVRGCWVVDRSSTSTEATGKGVVRAGSN